MQFKMTVHSLAFADLALAKAVMRQINSEILRQVNQQGSFASTRALPWMGSLAGEKLEVLPLQKGGKGLFRLSCRGGTLCTDQKIFLKSQNQEWTQFFKPII